MWNHVSNFDLMCSEIGVFLAVEYLEAQRVALFLNPIELFFRWANYRTGIKLLTAIDSKLLS